MALVKSYYSLLEEYKKKYGFKTFLLMQVGSFFEVYSTTNTDENICEFSQICDLKIANKNEGFMAGFRDYMLDKYISKINESCYTSVVYVQEEINGVTTRKELAIYSPGTTFIDDEQKRSNNITCIWIHKTKKDIIFGLSNLDIYTGKTIICEHQQIYYHNPTTYDNIEKFISVYKPIEIIFIYNIDETLIDNIIQYVRPLSRKISKISLIIPNSFTKQVQNCEKQIYQNEIIRTFYPNINHEHFCSSLFEKTIAFQSLCFLLNYISQHNAGLTTRLREPEIENSERVVLANHSLKQLNILENDYNGEYSSVVKLLNKCKTRIGQREMERMILNPITNTTKLQQSYDMIEHCLKNKYSWDNYLKQIKDIEKINRKMILKRATPIDLYNVYETCSIIKEIIALYKDDTILQYVHSSESILSIKKIQTIIINSLNLEICREISSMQFDKYPEIINKLINKGVNIELDNAIKDNVESLDKLKCIVDYLNKIFNVIDKKTNDAVKFNDGHDLTMTIIRKNKLEQYIKKIPNKSVTLSFNSSYSNSVESYDFDLNTLSFYDQKSNAAVEGSEIKKLKSVIMNTSQIFYKKLNDTYMSINTELELCDYTPIIFCIQQLDTLNTKCEIASLYNYSKPVIDVKENSYIKASNLRHVLIEHLEKNELYVANDVDIGNNPQGMLLFGTNAVGKTSFIKAIGICIIMAQAGLYVPCDNMVYSPYEYIFTRIIGNDNIFKGLSTFGVEMSELRVILNHCNSKSLILGDELCSGTEIDSALSIFTAGLETMYNNKSTFIFATHFHEIQYFNEIKQMDRLVLKHLTVKYDNISGNLVYDRKLIDGAGDSIYGLEVCKSLQMPDTFLKRAYEIRNIYDERNPNILNFKTTKYSKDKLRGNCEFCNNKIGTEMHHLQYQSTSNNNGYIDAFHKDHTANLASICESCHINIHSLGLVYERKKTFNGYKITLKKIK